MSTLFSLIGDGISDFFDWLFGLFFSSSGDYLSVSFSNTGNIFSHFFSNNKDMFENLGKGFFDTVYSFIPNDYTIFSGNFFYLLVGLMIFPFVFKFAMNLLLTLFSTAVEALISAIDYITPGT